MRATGDGAVGWRRKQQGRHHDGERHAYEGGREMESRGMGSKRGVLAKMEERRAGGGGGKARMIKGRQEKSLQAFTVCRHTQFKCHTLHSHLSNNYE